MDFSGRSPDPRRAAAAAGARELGLGFVPYSPLGHGFLTGEIRSTADISGFFGLSGQVRASGLGLTGPCRSRH